MKYAILAILLFISTTVFATTDSLDALMKQNNCYMCHSITKKVVGPAFTEVAKKYKNNAQAEDILTTKISKGGSGVWGSAPMPSMDVKGTKQQDMRRIVQFVLKQ